MRLFNTKTIQLKIAFWASVCLMVNGIVIVAYAVVIARSSSIQAANEHALSEARTQAGIVKAEIEVSLDATRTLAQALMAVKEPTNRLVISREQVNAMMIQVLIEHPQYLGVWTLWEPNAFDGQDARHANTQAYGESGRFQPYWHRGEGKIMVEAPTTDTGDWYQVPKKTHQEYISDLYTYPVAGKDTLMVTIVVPIVVDDVFYGVMGVDLSVGFLQGVADEVNVYDRTGKLFLIGNNGKVIATTGQPQLGEKSLSELMDQETNTAFQNTVKTGKENTLFTKDHLTAIVPILFGQVANRWAAVILVPAQAIVAPANALMWQLIGISLAMLLAGVAALWLVARQIARPIVHLTDMAGHIARGNLDIKANVKSMDEIGQLTTAFNSMTEQLRISIANLEQRTSLLQQSEEKYRTLVQKIQAAVVVHGADTQILISNSMAQELLGLTEDQMLGKVAIDPAWHFCREDGSALPLDEYPVNRVLASRRALRNFIIGVNRPQQEGDIWALVNAEPVFDRADVIEQVVVSFIDITELKRTGEALRINEVRYRNAQAMGHVGNWEYNLETNHFWGSDEAKRLYGFDLEDDDFSTEEVERCIPERERVHQALVDLLEKGKEYNLEFEIHPRHTSESRIIASVAELQRDEHGDPLKVVGVVQDITELKRAEDELRKHHDHLEELVKERTSQLEVAREQAERANRAKSIFLANMSHELRTPLNAVLGFSQVMKNSSDVTVEQRDNLDIITRSGEHLLNLINNVLDISKIESGRVGLEETHLDLYQLLQELKSLMYVQAHKKGLDFTLEQSPDLPLYVSVDGAKLRQVLINLIGNAIKYTASGAVILRAMAAEKEGAGLIRVRFEVEDTGPGIREEDKVRIFSPFEQLENRTPTDAGTGLGLAISKQHVGLMGGTIGVDGEPGKGSVFHFEIPVRMLSPEAMVAALQPGRVIGVAVGQPRYRLLIAEDHPENRLLLRNLLEPLGFDLREATNGQEAVALFAQWRPHLIWMDIRMPVMDGLEATRRIKATETGHGVKIIAVTAHALEEERREILAAGCDDFIRKPYKHGEILDALTKHLGVRFIYEEETALVAVAAELDAAALADLPAELLDELEQALVLIDINAVNRAIEAIRVHHPSQADALGGAARDLQFGRMLRMIRTASSETGPEDGT
ncbi:MAG: response regulator [Proteobacteria bacterium]|nr:response regulator [Pseudomonadota bacterium]MBU4296214.1 response regulator [Pseudomonadota bacterium]MCG2746428.1 response regulator [Desulfobulbaceae bacterium]